MRYLVVSDIHGSLEGVSVLEKAMEKHDVSNIICLGDILYHGPRNAIPADYDPKQVITIMNRYWHAIIAVRGNCDAEVDQMVLDFPITADANVFHLGQRRVFLSHGHIYGLDHLPKLEPGDIFLFGHTHLPMIEEQNGYYLLNPGSCGIPKGGHPRTYAILDDHTFTIYTFEHNVYLEITFQSL